MRQPVGAAASERFIINRTVAAVAEIATLRQKLAAAEARIREIKADKDNAVKPLTSWKSDKTKSTPTLDGRRERMSALLRDLPKDS